MFLVSFSFFALCLSIIQSVRLLLCYTCLIPLLSFFSLFTVSSPYLFECAIIRSAFLLLSTLPVYPLPRFIRTCCIHILTAVLLFLLPKRERVPKLLYSLKFIIYLVLFHWILFPTPSLPPSLPLAPSRSLCLYLLTAGMLSMSPLAAGEGRRRRAGFPKRWLREGFAYTAEMHATFEHQGYLAIPHVLSEEALVFLRSEVSGGV